MPTADLVIRGTILTVDEHRPTAEALAVADGHIVAVGAKSDVASWVGPLTRQLEVDGCVMPGFVEAHGHPLMEAVVLSDRVTGIRPVTLPTRTPSSRRSGPRSRPAAPTAPTSTAGIRFCSKAFRSRRWRG